MGSIKSPVLKSSEPPPTMVRDRDEVTEGSERRKAAIAEDGRRGSLAKEWGVWPLEDGL